MMQELAADRRPRSDDLALVARAAARDASAIRAILQANNRRLYRIARAIVRNDAEAEDVVQETYLRAFSRLDEFRGDAAFGTWLSRIAINEALGRLRSTRPTIPLETTRSDSIEAQIIPFPHAATDNPEITMAQQQIQRVVERAIDDLPDPFRIVFITRVVEGMNVEETANLLDLKSETVKTRLHRARALLRADVERQIGPVMMDAFPFAGARCERLTHSVLTRMGIAE